MPALLAVPTRYDRDRYRPLRTQRMADSLRVLALDVAAQPNGRPSGSTSLVEILVALWDRHLRHHPADPAWADRDRVVAHRPHAWTLHHALLHLTGYDLSMSALRGGQRDRRHPGCAELVRGSDADGGPDHGLAHAVGIALAEKLLGDEFNRDGHDIVDHRTWVFVDDHCLAHDTPNRAACALAAEWKLHKLVALYADEGNGEASGSNADTPARFRRHGWNVIGPVDGHDVDAIDAALRRAADGRDAPSLVVCRIGSGEATPVRIGTVRAHDEAMKADQARATRERLDWRHPPFELPGDVYESWNARERGEAACRDWQRRFAGYQRAFPELAAEFGRRMRGELPAGFHDTLISVLVRFGRSRAATTTDDASKEVLAALASALPELLGGSVAPGGSNLIRFPGLGTLRGTAHGGRHVDYGARASGMAAVMNGIALHGGFLPYGTACQAADGSDGCGDAMRTAGLGGRRAVHVFTTGGDEDTPAHGGDEDAPAGRGRADTAGLPRGDGLPQGAGLDVWQPCDAAETAVAWIGAIARAGRPSALLLSRHALPAQPRTPEQVLDVRRGGYVLSEREGCVATLLAAGPRVALAVEAQRLLDARGVPVRVVSMPSATVFDRQHAHWRDAVLPAGLPCIDVEAAVADRHAPHAEALADLVLEHAGASLATQCRLYGSRSPGCS